MTPGRTKTTLDNGVRVLTRTIPHARSVSVGIWLSAGARDERSGENGLSHFIEHMIFKGTTRRDAYGIAKAFDAIGAQTNAFTAAETTCYHARAMDTHLGRICELLGEIFLESIFDPDELERERNVILQEIDMVIDSPEEYIHQLAESAYWGDHPLGWPITGNPEDVERYEAADLREFFHRLYQPERILVSAAGNLSHQAVLDLVGPTFSAIRSSAPAVPRETPLGRPGVSVHERALGQVHMCLNAPGISAGDPRRYTAALLNTVLGGNMSSRLFQEIRERRGLAYSVYSFLGSYEDTGLLGVYAASAPARALETLAVTREVLAGLVSNAATEEDLRDAREYTKGALVMATESVDNQMARLAQNEITLGRHVPVDEVVAGIDAVTPDDLRDLAAHLLRPESFCLTLLGPVTDRAPFDEVARS